MRIALVGYGKMGKAIEYIALQRGHEVVLKISSKNLEEFTAENLKDKNVDVAIEFSKPDSAKNNALICLSAGVNVICGTTGWNADVKEVEAYALAHGLGFLQASNFSVGVNIFFEVNKALAAIMSGYTDYNASVEETHHTQKKDAPSGTAITIAEQILAEISRYKGWELDATPGGESLPVAAYRLENVPGTHVVKYGCAIDEIEIKHTAHNRDGFATGAVLAAEFINAKSGVYSMKDVLFNR